MMATSDCDLSFKQLSAIPEKALLKCSDIRTLNLCGNPGIQLLNSLGKFAQLRKLVLRGCALRAIPDEIAELTELKVLLLGDFFAIDKSKRNNFSRGLTSAIGRLGRLKVLDLQNCNVTTLPETIGELQQLEKLNLKGNNFSGGLPAAIGTLRRLKELDLRHCNLTTLPESIGNLEQLEKLDLRYNDLSGGLPADIGKLVRLKELSLQHCHLTTLPEIIGNLEQLETLDLRDNNLHEYPRCTLRMKSLRILDLSNDGRMEITPREGNCIKQLPIDLSYTSLKELKLSKNPIMEPPKAIWKQGINAIKSFMQALIPGGSLMHADTLNMIGDTGAEKTSLAQSLVLRSPRTTDEADRTQVLQQFSLKIDENASLSVNINDFGGHDIYHSVIPIFLPVNGLVILVFNLNDEQRKEHIEKWLLTAIAKSSEIRVIIVGAHADEVGERRSDLEIQLLAFVAECLESAFCEVSAHINHLNHRSAGAHKNKFEKLHQVRKNLQKALVDFSQSVIDVVKMHISLLTSRPDDGHCNLKYLQQLLAGLNNNIKNNTLPATVENNFVRFLTLSCLVADNGLDKLHKLVVKLLHPPETLPMRWCRVIVKMLKKRPECLYLTMKQVKNICRVHFTASDDSEALKTILRYLARTSQIIWLENHPKLCDYIFHSPQRIIDTCKKMLYHDIQTLSHLKECYKPELKAYNKGILLAPLLKALLSTNVERHHHSDEQAYPEAQLSQSANVVLHFMEQFNLLSSVRTESDSQDYIVPCNLSSAEPSDKLKIVECIGAECLNRVIVRLSFIGSIIPMSLFETSLSMILSVAGNVSGYRSRPDVWRDGVIMIYDGVYFIAKRRDSVITLVAFSKPGSPSPWTILHPVLKNLSDNVQASWHGAPPHCAVVCPGCARRTLVDDQESKKGEIPEDLTRLALTYQRGQVRPMCEEFCYTLIPQSLCYATEATGSFTNDHSDIEEFFRNVERMYGEASTNESSRKRKNLEKSGPKRFEASTDDDSYSKHRKNHRKKQVIFGSGRKLYDALSDDESCSKRRNLSMQGQKNSDGLAEDDSSSNGAHLSKQGRTTSENSMDDKSCGKSGKTSKKDAKHHVDSSNQSSSKSIEESESYDEALRQVKALERPSYDVNWALVSEEHASKALQRSHLKLLRHLAWKHVAHYLFQHEIMNGLEYESIQVQGRRQRRQGHRQQRQTAIRNLPQNRPVIQLTGRLSATVPQEAGYFPQHKRQRPNDTKIWPTE